MHYGYQSIAADLERRIRMGEWGEGERLPSISELEQRYPQSRMTLYKSLRVLEERGYVSMEHGRGTFVKMACPRLRIGILTGCALFRQGLAPFAFQAFRHAHAFFARHDMDSQLYAEDPLADSRLPAGLLEELARNKLAGLLTVDAAFPQGYMLTSDWRAHAIPHVNIGALPAPYRVYVDREAFIARAVAVVRARRRRRPALLEREEHLVDDRAVFLRHCQAAGLTAWPGTPTPPAADLPFEDYGFALLKRVWTQAPQPDAVIVPDDVIAKGIAQAALALGIRVPHDLLIIALTNRDAPLFYPVPLETMEVDVRAIVTRAARLLLGQIHKEPAEPCSILVPPRQT